MVTLFYVKSLVTDFCSRQSEIPTSSCWVVLVCRRPLMRWRTHGPVELTSELLTVVYVDVVEHILVHDVSLRRVDFD